LNTLDDTNLKCGMAEVVKYAFLCDKAFYTALLNKTLSTEEIIKRCVEIKSDVVAEDEFDRGTRKLLNFGHTLGHAIEALSKYEITHGLAVSMGMMAITEISYKNGLCDETTVIETKALLNAYDLPVSSPYTLSELSDKMLSDKKVEGSKIDLIIPKETGNCVIYPQSLTELKGFIEKGTDK
ncbi:MAG: 3-dehydroquinate synthase, partial [Clostridia bacterium]|nr:3-dehydroquinate synthase [Clostridia bacterium]